MIKDSITFFILIILFAFLSFTAQSSGLEPLLEDELYDTSGRATPTVSIKYSDELTVDYFNQNVFIFEPQRGEQYAEINNASWIDPGTNKAVVLNWSEPVKFFFEFDKYQYYPDGIYISVSDIFKTGEDGRTLPEYAEFENIPHGIIPPNTTYLRTKSSASTVTTLKNQFDIAFVDTVKGKSEITGKETLQPDWEQAKDPNNQLVSIFWSGKVRTEQLGYIYIWTHY